MFGLTNVQLGAALKAEGIDSRRYYAPPIHRQQAYAHLRGQRELPVTDEMASRVLTPPLYSHMTPEQATRVATTVRRLQTNADRVAERQL